MKTKSIFICSSCGHRSHKWEGKCHSCHEWNSYEEEVVNRNLEKSNQKSVWRESMPKSNHSLPLAEIKKSDLIRIRLKDKELNRTMGGGLVPGSVTLLGGEPGIGKSTLLLQLAIQTEFPVLYVSGEESKEQIKMRADRIGDINQLCRIMTETDLEKILSEAVKVQTTMLVIDSIQTISSAYLESTPGSLTQVRECTAELQSFAKETGISVLIIGHINKEGHIAGPKILEHIVDTVLQFEGDRNHIYRILRTRKNRFGSTEELGIYAMESTGLRAVENPSEILLSQSDEKLSGSAVASTIEGLRPMMIETQALVSPAIYGTPQRSATGFDLRRLSMLLAVLEKRAGLFFGQSDVFLNMAGGLKVQDTAIDLSVIAALVSSLDNIPVDRKICFAGEIGLTGEVRAVTRIDQRIEEAARLGFEEIYISRFNKTAIGKSKNIVIHPLGKVEDLVEHLFDRR